MWCTDLYSASGYCGGFWWSGRGELGGWRLAGWWVYCCWLRAILALCCFVGLWILVVLVGDLRFSGWLVGLLLLVLCVYLVYWWGVGVIVVSVWLSVFLVVLGLAIWLLVLVVLARDAVWLFEFVLRIWYYGLLV